MRKIIFALFILSSLSAYAGDMYLVCEDEKNDDFRSVSINKGKARLVLPMIEQIAILEINEMRSNIKTRYDLKVTYQSANQKKQIKLNLFEEIKVGSYICLVRD
jgi:hypothetical protein